MKNFYFVIVLEVDGRRAACVDKVAQGANVCGRWGDGSKDVKIAHPCHTKKEAFALAERWNANFEKYGKKL